MRLSTYLVAVPAVIVAAVVAIANRHAVTFSLDPFSRTAPAFSVHIPLFLLLFAVLLLGVLLGWLVAVLTRKPPRPAGGPSKTGTNSTRSILPWRK